MIWQVERREISVQKGLCIAALSIAVIVLILFLADMILGLFGLFRLAPFKYSSLTMDIVFSICSGILAYMSWVTFKQQV